MAQTIAEGRAGIYLLLASLMTPPPSSPWEALRAGFRRVCVRRLVGDEEGAVNALKEEIPSLVVGWVKTSSLNPVEKKAKLKEVFDDESARAEELATAFELFAAKFEAKVAARVSEEVSKAREEMFHVATKFEDALVGFSEKFEQLLSQAHSLSTIPALEPPPAEEPAAEPVPESELVPVAEPVEVSGPEPRSEQAKPEPEIREIDDKKEAEPKSEPEPKTVPQTVVETEKEDDLDQSSSDELEPEPEQVEESVPLRGIRFDEIEDMIDELLSQEQKPE